MWFRNAGSMEMQLSSICCCHLYVVVIYMCLVGTVTKPLRPYLADISRDGEDSGD